jgi:hypothetical protein
MATVTETPVRTYEWFFIARDTVGNKHKLGSVFAPCQSDAQAMAQNRWPDQRPQLSFAAVVPAGRSES